MSKLTEEYYQRMWDIAKEQFVLDEDSIHGFDHWEAVYNNAVLFGDGLGADIDVLKHFAIFHDCKRVNDNQDPSHGLRASDFLKSIRDQIELDDNQFILLEYAVRYHNKPVTTNEVNEFHLKGYDPLPLDTDFRLTIGACWDSDRLELLRCGVCPISELMNTPMGQFIADKLFEVKDRVGSGLM